ncbi:Hypothetical_protein [Hexamita inflata]|uniref:Hypothetical_protein n=1 Tax=Hexamita inflata TaxID=28002 RepID=A0AA86P6K0_9EUKA|nr:Hypothetical protein HINF_LOCUS18955 [Hexamita inflata]
MVIESQCLTTENKQTRQYPPRKLLNFQETKTQKLNVKQKPILLSKALKSKQCSKSLIIDSYSSPPDPALPQASPSCFTPTPSMPDRVRGVTHLAALFITKKEQNHP